MAKPPNTKIPPRSRRHDRPGRARPGRPDRPASPPAAAGRGPAGGLRRDRRRRRHRGRRDRGVVTLRRQSGSANSVRRRSTSPSQPASRSTAPSAPRASRSRSVPSWPPPNAGLTGHRSTGSSATPPSSSPTTTTSTWPSSSTASPIRSPSASAWSPGRGRADAGAATSPAAPACFYWMHVHAQDGIIHIESPTPKTYELGQFFDIWGLPLSSTQIGPTRAP